MELFECQQVMEHWASIFSREIREGEVEAWFPGFRPFTKESFSDAFQRYIQSVEIMRWPTPRNIKDLLVPAPFSTGRFQHDGNGQYVRRNGESDVEFMERSCGPDWREKTEKGIRGLRKMGIPYGGKILMSAEYWRSLGVRLPEDGMSVPEVETKQDDSGEFKGPVADEVVIDELNEFQEEAPY